MKKIALSTLSLALLGATGAAHAQSSVTLYGVIDNSLTYVHNASGNQHMWALGNASAGDLAGSRWGVKGQEDLGNGLSAIFQLENGFDPSNGRNGQGNREFGRQAFVGLSSAQFGTVTLGRQYDPVVDLVQAITADNYFGSSFATPGDVDNYDNSSRTSNAIKFQSITYAGLQFEAMYAFGGVAGQFGQNSTIGGALSYSAGPLYVGAGYFYARNPGVQFDDGNFNANQAPGAVNPTTGIWGLVGLPRNMQVASLGASYTMGPALFGANFSDVRFDDANGVVGNKVRFDSAELWGQYSLTPATTLGAGYTFTFGKVDATGQKPKYGQLNLVADYRLSKRTDVYAMGVYQHAMSGGVTADIYAAEFSGASTTKNQVAARVGIRHKF